MSMDKISNYINNYGPTHRDTVLDQIVKNRLIQEAINSPEGSALFNSVVDTIAEKTRGIVHSCTAEFKKDQMDKIQKLASEIYVAFNLMKDWANIIKAGEKHEEAMTKP